MAKFISMASALLLAAAMPVSCDKFEESSETGTLELQFSDCYRLLGQGTRSASLPDTNNFILSVCNSSGQAIYKGKFGDSPQKISAAPGNYTVSIVSCEFTEPLFDSPQYGDTQTVEIRAGETSGVKLDCIQTNAGIRLEYTSDFIETYGGATPFLKSADGSLLYGYSESRTAYFNPGVVSLVLDVDGTEKTLFSRMLLSREILSVKLSSGASSLSKEGIHVAVDTSVTRRGETFIPGTSDRGSGTSNALSVNEAISCGEKSGVWVYGYIVGGDLTGTKCSFEAPFSSRTNIVLATRSSCRDRSCCLSVQLSTGDARETLNLVDHPDNLGKQIFLKGNLVDAYYGIPGIRNITEFQWK